MDKKKNKKRKVLVALCLNKQKPMDIKVLEYQIESISDSDARISANAYSMKKFGVFPLSTKVI